MKPYLLFAGAAVSFFSSISPAYAGDPLRLQTEIYVFKNSDFREVAIPGATSRNDMVFKSPAVAKFDQLTLSLDGSRFAWNGGDAPPDQFSVIASPTVPAVHGKPVT